MGYRTLRSRSLRTWLLRWHRVALALLVVTAAMVGCVADDPEMIDGTGGAAGTASTGTTGGTGGTGGTGVGPTGGSGGGGGSCNSPEDCPGLDTTCSQRSCDAHVCGFVFAVPRTSCNEDGGRMCDGVGNCVECVLDEDCNGTDVCDSNACVAPPACTDGSKNGLETDVDCGGPACPPCATGSECLQGDDCQSGFCADGYCCDTACSDACAVCDRSGAEGTCGAAPHGAAGNPSCSPYVCDGVDTTCPSSCADSNDCASGHTCSASNQCEIAGTCGDPPFDCDGSSATGCECNAGTGCCGTSCQYTHNNGQGQNYYDCVVPGTYDVIQATKACEAYAGVGNCGGATCSTGSVICNFSGGGDCACWGYTDEAAGRVFNYGKMNCYCPDATDPMWD